MWAARRKASGTVRSRVRPSSRWRLNSAGAASGTSAFGASRTSPPRACSAFLQEAVEPWATIQIDGWRGYARLPVVGYRHPGHGDQRQLGTGARGHAARPQSRRPAQNRGCLGTLQGGIQDQHLDDYLDEFTFRFNRCRSQARGLLFHRLVQQAVAIGPVLYHFIITPRISGQSPRIGGMKRIPTFGFRTEGTAAGGSLAAPAPRCLGRHQHKLPARGRPRAPHHEAGTVPGPALFSPAAVNPIVEVVMCGATAPATVETALDFCRASGKQPLRCQDSYGFAVNRLLLPLHQRGGACARRGAGNHGRDRRGGP